MSIDGLLSFLQTIILASVRSPRLYKQFSYTLAFGGFADQPWRRMIQPRGGRRNVDLKSCLHLTARVIEVGTRIPVH
jgi:hypothetical protein